jgi:uncharacterized protein YpmS
MRLLALATALVALVAAAGTPADMPVKTVSLQPWKPAPKAKIKVESTRTTITAISAGGKEDKTTEKVILNYIETYDDLPEFSKKTDKDKDNTEIRRVYSLATIDNGVAPKTLSMQSKDKPVLITKKDKRSDTKFEFTFDGKALADAESVEILDNEFNIRASKYNFRSILASGKIDVDKEAQLDSNRIKEIITDENMVIGEPGGTLKVSEATQSDKLVSGKIVIELTIPVHALTDKTKDALDTKGKGHLKVNFEGKGCLNGLTPDGNSTTTVTLDLKKVKINGTDVDIFKQIIETRSVGLSK